jgi:hypothetical protein
MEYTQRKSNGERDSADSVFLVHLQYFKAPLIESLKWVN